MKMSDVFDLPVKSSQLEVYGANSNKTISFDEIENAAAYAINNHDRLADFVKGQRYDCIKVIGQLENLGILDAWTCCKLNDMIQESELLLKELGHEI